MSVCSNQVLPAKKIRVHANEHANRHTNAKPRSCLTVFVLHVTSNQWSKHGHTVFMFLHFPFLLFFVLFCFLKPVILKPHSHLEHFYSLRLCIPCLELLKSLLCERGGTKCWNLTSEMNQPSISRVVTTRNILRSIVYASRYSANSIHHCYRI